jgi:RHS repeat-associated protein
MHAICTTAVLTLVAAAAPAAYAERGPAPSAATASKATLPDGPASVRGLAGSADIGAPMAQVQYAIDVEVPRGGGVAPAVSLQYAGELGNGPAGVGWSLGQASIRRSTRHGVPHFSDEDEIEISGVGTGRLVRIPDGTYRVEGAGNTIRAVRVGNRWEVADGNGVVTFFGVSAASRQEATVDGQLRTTAWLPEIAVHPSGKTVRYRYTHDRNQRYLTGATWGPGDRHHLEIELEARPDVVTSYREGFEVVTARRIRAIRVLTSGEVVRAYHIAYSEALPLSRIASVRLVGRGDLPGPDNELAPVTFQYAAPSSGGIVKVEGTDGWTLGARGVALLDVDGDGMDDLVRLEMGNHQYRPNLGGHFGAARPLTGASSIELAAAQLLDLDGDARADLVRVVDDSWRGYRMEDGGWQAMGAWPGSDGVPLTGTLVDLDGDGRTDVVQGTATGLRVWFNGPTGVRGPVSRPHIAGNGSLEPGRANVRFTDINGDGLVDVAWITDDSLTYFLGRGDGTFAPWRRVFHPWGAGVPIDPTGLHLVDLDRDGLVDLVRVSIGHVAYYRGTADAGFRAPVAVPRPESADADVVVTITDGNGNGSADVVWSSPRGLWILDLAGPTSAGMLASIDNGMGQVTAFAYQASAQLAVAAEQSGQPWQHRLPVSIPVPVEREVRVAGAAVRRVQWGVRDGLWDGVERRFAGFLTTRRVTGGATARDILVTTATYHPGLGAERVLRGQPVTAEQANGLGEVRVVERTRWDAVRVGSLPDHPWLRRAVPRSKVVEHREGVTTPITTVSWVTTDDEGRITQEYDAGRSDRSGDESLTTRRYADGASPWIRDRVCEESVYSGDGRTLASSTRHHFGGPIGPLAPHCQVGLGLERKVEGLLAEEGRWVTRSETSYDEHWNPVDILVGGVRRRLGYDDAGAHLTSEEIAPGEGEVLRYTMTWDEVLAVPASATAPDGVSTRLTYDGLARVTAVALGAALPHIRYRYDWASSRPVTRTYVFDRPLADVTALPEPWTPGSGWRETVDAVDGAGAVLYSATRLAAAHWIVKDWQEHDDRGRVVAVAEPFYWTGADPALVARASTDPVQAITYDAFDRKVAQELPTGARKVWSYAAFEATVTGDGVAPVRTMLDGKQRIARTERTVAGILESVDATFDPADRITAMVLQAGTPAAVEHRFDYDTLGRLRFATDPDIGDRNLLHDDGDRLVEQTNAMGQTVEYGYDGAGRLTSIDSDDGSFFRYHYDLALDDDLRRTRGRLAWVEEATGRAELGYDELGRPAVIRRAIAGATAEEATTFAASGLPRRVDHRDGFAFDVDYDAAGRAIAVGALWTVEEQDAAGRVLRERFGNDVTQAMGPRNGVGQPEAIAVRRSDGTALYDALLTYTGIGELHTVTDRDGHGLDHGATFTYDGAARLTAAVIGSGADGFHFAQTYDGLQNMVRREASGPRPLGTLTGAYQYGEPVAGAPRRGPRQLRAVVPDGGGPAITFDYDGAGRQIRQGARSLAYNGLDQLIRVTGVGSDGAGTVEHAYGYDGLRVLTRGPDGSEQRWFTENLAQAGAIRDHYVRLGGRLIARVSQAWQGDAAVPTTAGASTVVTIHLVGLAAGGLLVLLLLAVPTARGRRRRALRPALAMLLVLTTTTSGCTTLWGDGEAALWSTTQTLYYHQTVGAGPTMSTRDDGSIFEERRYEPFGGAIDAFRELPGGGTEVGTIDATRDPSNILNKVTDPSTGWSYHGARWMAPETARWLTPDPPVKGPDPAFLNQPWCLHPYQFVNQNPIKYWDPDGREPNHAVFDNTYQIGVRRYAPFENFSGFKGDPRWGTTDRNVSYRAGLFITIHPDSGRTIAEADSTGSHWSFSDFEYMSKPEIDVMVSPLIGGARVTAGMAASNPCILGAPDIDTFITVEIMNTTYAGQRAIRITGTVYGDKFPNAEVFIRDGRGNGVLLLDYWTSSGSLGPLYRLFFAGRDNVVGRFDATLLVDENGTIIGPAPGQRTPHIEIED